MYARAGGLRESVDVLLEANVSLSVTAFTTLYAHCTRKWPPKGGRPGCDASDDYLCAAAATLASCAALGNRSCWIFKAHLCRSLGFAFLISECLGNFSLF